MAGLNTGDILQISFVGTLFSQRVLNVLHYRVTADSTSPSYVTAAGAVGFQMQSGVVTPGLAMLAAQGPEYNLDYIRVQKVNGTRLRYVDYAVNLPGTVAGNCTAPNIAATITKKTENGTRHGIGSLHLPGIPSNGYANGVLDATYKLLVDAISARLINPFTVQLETTQCQPILWSKSIDPVYHPLTNTVVQNTIRVMRRRTVGVGK